MLSTGPGTQHGLDKRLLTKKNDGKLKAQCGNVLCSVAGHATHQGGPASTAFLVLPCCDLGLTPEMGVAGTFHLVDWAASTAS